MLIAIIKIYLATYVTLQLSKAHDDISYYRVSKANNQSVAPNNASSTRNVIIKKCPQSSSRGNSGRRQARCAAITASDQQNCGYEIEQSPIKRANIHQNGRGGIGRQRQARRLAAALKLVTRYAVFISPALGISSRITSGESSKHARYIPCGKCRV